MFLIAASLVSAWLITVAKIPGEVIALFEPFMGDRILLMAAIMVLVVLVGTALDSVPTILILTPVLMPVIMAAGMDLVYFGVLFIMNNAIGLVMPPVGTTLNVVCSVTGIKIGDPFIGVLPFMISQLIVLSILVVFQDLILVPMRFLVGY